jgi:hypothetical protein
MTLAATAVIAAIGLAFYGWGTLLRRLAAMPEGRWPVTVVLGMAVAVAAGGVFNLIGIAVRWVLDAFALAGIGLAIWRLRQTGLPRPERHLALVILPIAAIVIFTIATQLPPSSYNFEDDFHKYFIHPVRMLATGTVASGPLSAMGAETLGATAFLDSFVLTLLPVDYLNAVDGVFALFLCLAMAATATRHRLTAAACVLAVFAIDPQVVNISALYLAAAAMMAVVMLAAGECEAGREPAPHPAPIGLIAAALIAMKPVFLLFVVLAIPALAVSLALATHSARRTAIWTGACLGWTVLSLAPWIAIHAPHYLAWWQTPPTALTPTVYKEPLALFDFGQNQFGVPPILYAGAGLIAMAAAFAAAWRQRHATAHARTLFAAAFALVLAGCYLGLAATSSQLAGWGTALRYFTPFAIALVPALLAVSLPELDVKPSLRGAVAAIALIPVMLFASRLWLRVYQASEYGNVLAFSGYAASSYNLAFNKAVLADGNRKRVAALQAAAPPGEPIVAWIDAPFWLDYERNPILEADSAGLAAPWAKLPEHGYFMLDYATIALNMPAPDEKHVHVLGAHEWMVQVQLLRFLNTIQERNKDSIVLFNDGRAVVTQRSQAATRTL